jgi:hypothetical protein
MESDVKAQPTSELTDGDLGIVHSCSLTTPPFLLSKATWTKLPSIFRTCGLYISDELVARAEVDRVPCRSGLLVVRMASMLSGVGGDWAQLVQSGQRCTLRRRQVLAL